MKTAYETKLAERKEALKDFFGGNDGEEVTDEMLKRVFQYEELMIKYRSAIREVTTKLEILNDELSTFLDTSDEWIRTRTGIVTRHVAATETLDELAEAGYDPAVAYAAGGVS